MFEDLDGRFRVTIYRRKATFDDYGVVYPALNEKSPSYNSHATENKILSLLKEHPDITQQKLSDYTHMSIITIKRIMKKLQEENKIKRVGNNRKGHWMVL